ncbi:MAG: hypothetical protein CMJ83_09515 [Planctomycetes bacterium]|nr:hypothetical protein [Planctomycetota bacterium]
MQYFGQHRIVGGVYSRVRGRAVIHDSVADALRAYAPGESGGGTIIATGLSASASSGEQASLIEISSSNYLTGMSSTTSSISLSAGGTQALAIDVGPALGGAVYFAAGSFSGWTPGFSLGGKNVPLNMDAYFTFALTYPNQLPLLNNFANLDPQGQATVAFQLPAGSAPSLAGIVLHHAAAIIGPLLTVDAVTNAVPVELVL